ncbi:sigma-54-dependent Fis family transcriptional regulator [Bacteroidales bacterium AH-315-I05]|nr:sigma-54-dependent Fis family transcriptional regulator [Bacteroidales bacterium AH-315-I05]
MKIFIVEDEPMYAKLLDYTLSLNPDYEVKKFVSGKDCLDHLYLNPDLVTLDYYLPDISGDEVLKKIKKHNPNIAVIIVSGQEDIATAVKLLKKGAYDYVVKNEDVRERLLNIVGRIRENIRLKDEINTLKEEIGKKYEFNKVIIGQSEAIKKTFSLMEKAAASNITVSITGETGTGKELVAKAIHYQSDIKKYPLVAVNVAAIPHELIESELFGHEKGAFTGATSRRIGKFEQASKGTIFLDEISEMDETMQAKLLRVLQEKELTRVGGNSLIKIDARVIVATNKKLTEEMKKGNFREDLYYRLLGLPIHLEPLRNRGNDILIIAKHFLERFCENNKMKKLALSQNAQNKLSQYAFPGNVRELKATIELAAVMCNSDAIAAGDIHFNAVNPVDKLFEDNMTLKEYTNNIINVYLEKYNNDALLVAKKLDIGKSTVYRAKKKNKFDT